MKEIVTKNKTMREFMEFLKEYKIVGLAMAFVMGAASTTLVKSIVDNLVMPLINPLVKGDWSTAVLNIGPFAIKWGAFLSDFINFVAIAVVVFFIAKKILKEEKVSKK